MQTPSKRTIIPLIVKRDILTQMREDLHRALKKQKAVHWGMVIDQDRCIGCHACTVACIAENALPEDVVYRPVIEKENGIYPHLSRTYLPKPCMQCQNPPCTRVCPVSATWKDENTGITVIEYSKCIGCRYCLKACPYGARVFDSRKSYNKNLPSLPTVLLSKEGMDKGYAQSNIPENKQYLSNKTPRGIARKCHFCLHRIQVGILPACVTSCIAKATFFGNLNDKKSLVYQMKASSKAYERGLNTQPSVTYLKQEGECD